MRYRATHDSQNGYPKRERWRGEVAKLWRWAMAWVLALLIGLMGMASPSWAVGEASPATVEATPSAPTKTQPDASAVPSETVSRFVSAYLEVVKLIEAREQSLQSAETDTESRQMQQEIQAEAVALIQSHDLTLQAYWELLGLANSDPEFRERVLAQIEEASL